MPELEWNEGFSVQVPEMDADHRHIFSLLNELGNKMMSPERRDLAADALDKLDRYARGHLKREELLLRLRGYPRYADHKAEHDAYTAKVTELRGRLPDERGDLAVRIVNYLREWWTGHILGSDREYAKFFAGTAGPEQ